MKAQYPNLELLEYKTTLLLSKDEDFKKKFEDLRKESRYACMDLNAYVFPQLWGSTCTGFDICEDGSPAIGGCAMTWEYTTVFHEATTDTYVVFFGDRPCYQVSNPKQAFLDDLNRRQMESLSGAKRLY